MQSATAENGVIAALLLSLAGLMTALHPLIKARWDSRRGEKSDAEAAAGGVQKRLLDEIRHYRTVIDGYREEIDGLQQRESVILRELRELQGKVAQLELDLKECSAARAAAEAEVRRLKGAA